MPRRTEKSNLHGRQVDRLDSCGLGSVQHKIQPIGVCKLRKTLDRQFDSQDVGCMSADNRLGIVPDCISERFYRLVILLKRFRDRVIQLPTHRERMYWPKHRIVLEVGDNHVVARPYQPFDRRIQGIGAVLGKDHLPRILRAKKCRDLFPHAVDLTRCLG